MLRAFVRHNGRPIAIDASQATAALPPDAVWIDLDHPTAEEERLVESELDIDIPTREEMQEIEDTSRLYHEKNALFMTVSVISRFESDKPEISPVTFILVGDRLVTLRYAEPKSFLTFLTHAERHPSVCATGAATLGGLLEAIVDRIADVLELVGRDLDDLSTAIFDREPGGKGRLSGIDFQELLRRVGRNQGRTAKVRDSLVSLSRLLSFLALPREEQHHKGLHDHVESLARDVSSLTQHGSSITTMINFQLDALLGMINVEQNGIIKIFSVASVALMPPTLIASIYGMNFKAMPELDWSFGYPVALTMMVVSAILPYLYFKRRGWL
jgi:magnesium transporter